MQNKEQHFTLYDFRGEWASKEAKIEILRQINGKLDDKLDTAYTEGYKEGYICGSGGGESAIAIYDYSANLK